MIDKKLFFKKDGSLFSNGYERVVHGSRGNYVELTKEQIQVELKSKYNQPLPDLLSSEDFFYYWLVPNGRDEKVYWQCNLVNYADYKRNHYYISPDLLVQFQTINNLNCKFW